MKVTELDPFFRPHCMQWLGTIEDGRNLWIKYAERRLVVYAWFSFVYIPPVYLCGYQQEPDQDSYIMPDELRALLGNLLIFPDGFGDDCRYQLWQAGQYEVGGTTKVKTK